MDGMVLSGDDEDQYAQRDDASDGVSRWLRRDHSQNVLEGSEGDETSSEDGKVVDSALDGWNFSTGATAADILAMQRNAIDYIATPTPTPRVAAARMLNGAPDDVYQVTQVSAPQALVDAITQLQKLYAKQHKRISSLEHITKKNEEEIGVAQYEKWFFEHRSYGVPEKALSCAEQCAQHFVPRAIKLTIAAHHHEARAALCARHCADAFTPTSLKLNLPQRQPHDPEGQKHTSDKVRGPPDASGTEITLGDMGSMKRSASIARDGGSRRRKKAGNSVLDCEF